MLEKKMYEKGIKCKLEFYPKGKNRVLEHVFAISYPKYEESQDVIEKLVGLSRSVSECNNPV